jgi:modulator of FtsH protease HflC
MNRIYLYVLPLLAALGLLAATTLYQVGEWEQVILTQFGRRVGDPVTTAGLHFKTPFIQKVNRFDKRILEWDGSSSEMPTRDKLFLVVDTFARWRIVDAGRYFERLRDERSARSRLDDILGGETRNAVAAHDLIEIIRTTKDRTPMTSEGLSEALGETTRLDPIRIGRPAIEARILATAKPKMEEFGIELLDVRFKRINYNPQVEPQIFGRMISERKQIAERFRSEGAGEAARILGSMEKEMNTIQSEAYRKVQAITGKADAEASAIYAEAYDRSDASRDFYRFLKTMETYRVALGGDTTAILSTSSPLLRYLQSEMGDRPAQP